MSLSVCLVVIQVTRPGETLAGLVMRAALKFPPLLLDVVCMFVFPFVWGQWDIGRVGEGTRSVGVFPAQGAGTGSFTPQSNNRVEKISISPPCGDQSPLFLLLLDTRDYFIHSTYQQTHFLILNVSWSQKNESLKTDCISKAWWANAERRCFRR